MSGEGRRKEGDGEGVEEGKRWFVLLHRVRSLRQLDERSRTAQLATLVNLTSYVIWC